MSKFGIKIPRDDTRSNFTFDWNMVAFFDPSYTQYLKDTWGVENKDCTIHGALEIEQDIAQLHQEIEEYDNWRTQDLTNEELEVLQQVHGEDIKKTKVKNTNTHIEQYKKKCNYVLKSEYKEQPAGPIPTVPLIGPPKSVLSEGSVIRINEDLAYKTSYSAEKNPFVVNLIKDRYYKRVGKIGMAQIYYRFDRNLNVTSDIRRNNMFAVYNTKTANLYIIRYKKSEEDKRAQKKITRASINLNHVSLINQRFPQDFVKRFMWDIFEHVVKIVPDMYFPSELDVDNRSDIIYMIYCLLLQHKVGKRLEWLGDINLVNNISHLYTLLPISELVISKYNDMKPETRKRKFCQKHLYTIIDKLKSKQSSKVVVRTMLGEHYKDIYYKLLNLPMGNYNFNAPNFIINLAYNISKGYVDKHTYHIIVKLIKNKSLKQLKEYYNLFVHYNIEDINDFAQLIDLFNRTVDNFYGKGMTVKWNRFRDTVEMAKRMNVRFRVNKIQTTQDLNRLHDQLARYQQRDLEVKENYSNFKFLKFESPDKEYNGFKFIQLTTPQELVDEGRNMHHCVGGYSHRCLNGNSIIYSMSKGGKSWVTIEINGAELNCPILQKYTIKDFAVQNQSMIDTIEEWRKDLENLHSGDEHSYKFLAKSYYDLQKQTQYLDHLERSVNEGLISVEVFNRQAELTQSIINSLVA